MGDLTRKLQLQNLTDRIGPAELPCSKACIAQKRLRRHTLGNPHLTLKLHSPIEEEQNLDDMQATSGVF